MDRRASKTRFDLSEDSEQEEDDDEDEDEEADTGLSFWPSAEEFKDLLLDESRFRVDVAGDWLAPYGSHGIDCYDSYLIYLFIYFKTKSKKKVNGDIVCTRIGYSFWTTVSVILSMSSRKALRTRKKERFPNKMTTILQSKWERYVMCAKQ